MTRTTALRRRDFLRGAAVVGGTGLAGLALGGVAGAVTTTRAWTLNPDWGFPRGAHGETSCGCRACLLHSENKIFAGKAALAAGRAHAGCLCTPLAIRLPTATFDALFTIPGVGVVDRRDPQVAAILASNGSPDPDPGQDDPNLRVTASTGVDLRGPAALMGALVVVGGGATLAARRGRVQPDVASR